jgi:predicted dinucleotide-binding enzyme
LVKRTGANASVAGSTEAAAQAQVILLAVPGEVVEEVASNLGNVDGKDSSHIF